MIHMWPDPVQFTGRDASLSILNLLFHELITSAKQLTTNAALIYNLSQDMEVLTP